MAKIIQRLLEMAAGQAVEGDLFVVQDVSVPKTKVITLANLRRAIFKKASLKSETLDLTTPFPGMILDEKTLGQGSWGSTSTYIPNSNLTVVVPEGFSSFIITVSASLSLTRSGSGAGQAVIELFDGHNATGSLVARRIPTTSMEYDQAVIVLPFTGKEPGTYYFSLGARTSSGTSSMRLDPISAERGADKIFATLAG